MKRSFRGFFINLFLIGTGVLVSYLLSRRSGLSFFSQHPLTLFGLVLAVAISSLAVILKATRFYYYGLLVFLAMAVGELLSATITAVDPYLVAVIGAGAIILSSGIIILARFLRKYPVISLEG